MTAAPSSTCLRIARMLRKQFAQHLATLKQVLEGAAVTA